MCGRYTLDASIEELAERFAFIPGGQLLQPRYNVAPTQIMPVIIRDRDERQMRMMRWGLVPFWAKDRSIGNRLINARAESAHEKASFKHALKSRRCIVPADGYYEWQKLNGSKQAMRIIDPASCLIGFAGLWEQWQDSEGEPLLSYTILTTNASSSLAEIHDRMPFILSPDQEETWLEGPRGEESLHDFVNSLVPRQLLTAYPVSNRVNSPKFDDPTCIQPLA